MSGDFASRHRSFWKTAAWVLSLLAVFAVFETVYTARRESHEFFRPEFESLIRDKVDPTRSLPGFIKYVVRSQTDEHLPAALEICPTSAVIEENGVYHIEEPLCIRCGACKEVAPNAIEIRDRIPAFTAAEAAGG